MTENNYTLVEKKNPFGYVTVYKNYSCAIMNEGIIVKPADNNELTDLVSDYLQGSEFVYIPHRMNTYSIDPTVYFIYSKIEAFNGFVIVDPYYDESRQFETEQHFSSKPFKRFNTL